MKRILEIAIVFFSFACNAQHVKMKGYYTFYQREDSVASFSLPHSITVFNAEHKKIYEEHFTQLGDSTSSLFFEDDREAPELTIKGYISKKDTTKIFYTKNCDTGEKFIIQGSDTTNRYTIICHNNELVKMVCTEGFLTSDTLIKVGDKEYWKTTFPDNTIEYSMREFDKKRRIVLARWGMSNRSDSTGNFSKYEYDDEEYIETITSSRIGVEATFGTIVINYCNSNWIPLKREVIELNDGIKTLRRFEFTRIE